MSGLKVGLLILVVMGSCLAPAPVKAQVQVNLPYFGSSPRMNEAAIFWFGQVNNHSNYADVRTGYTDTNLIVSLNIMDRYLWYDPTHQSQDMKNWDAVSLYLSTDPTPGNTITPNDYQFTGELKWWENGLDYQIGYQGNSNQTWTPLILPLVAQSGWRGDAPNNLTDDRGWAQTFTLPYTLISAGSPPPPGTTWHLGLVMHDRDSSTGAPEPDQSWPPGFEETNPSTWGTIHFGIPTATPPAAINPTTYTIRQDSTHQVVDAVVGGYSDCGSGAAPDYFPTWGSKTYTGNTTITEQNQTDIADWPCFAKMLFKFPLTTLPSGKVVTQAILTLHQFGNSDPTQATQSYLQVLTTTPDWTESTVNWNNTPEAFENVAAAWVEPVSGTIVWPGWQRDFDVTYGVSKTYAANQPTLAVAIYSADSDYHSGKYFTSGDAGDWDLVGRPTLTITLADPVTTRPGDFNLDGKVDLNDWLLFLPHFGSTNTNFNLLGNSVIDIFDLNQLLKLFGK